MALSKIPTAMQETLVLPDSPVVLTSETFRLPTAGRDMSVSANTDVVWFSKTFTTKKANSKILITYHSGQIRFNATNSSINPRMGWSVNSNSLGVNMNMYRDHNHEWYEANPGNNDMRIFISGQAITDAVAAGTHTVYCHAGAYTTAATFGHQASTQERGCIITFQEIAQ